jgi:hypothetical protein
VKGVDLFHLVKAAFANNKTEHDHHWALLDPKVKDYLKDVPKEAYCTYAALLAGVQVNGERTSNRCEHEMKRSIEEGIRHECILMAMVRTVALNARLFSESREVCAALRASQNVLIPWAQEHYKEVKEKSTGNYVVNTDGGLCKILVSYNGQVEYTREVNLDKDMAECSCQLQDATGCVCAHIILAIRAVSSMGFLKWANAGERLRSFFHEQYFADAYLAAYESTPPVERPRMDELLPDNTILPPIIPSSGKTGRGGSRKK